MSAATSTSPVLSVLAWLAPVACSLAYAPLLDHNGYVLTAALLGAGPMLAAVLLRWARAPAWSVLPGQLLALAVWGTLLYFPETALGGLLPTEATVQALATQMSSGIETANQYAPPAPADTGLALLLAVAVVVCYLAVDLLGVGLGRVPLTGLPLLALYTVPAALVPGGVPALAFLPAAAAFLLLLGYDERERLGHWGRQVGSITGTRSTEEQRRLTAGALTASATRVGAVALGCAVVLPVFVPVLPQSLLEGGPGDGDGSGQVQVTNPIVDLRRDLVRRSEETALLVRTRRPNVSYFRLAALDEFDGQKWKFSDRDVDSKFDIRGGLTAPPGLAGSVRTRTERYRVQVSPSFHSDWLPAPYAPTRVRVGGEWRYDPATLDIVAGTDRENAAGRSYTVGAVQALPTFEQLDSAGGAPTSISGRYTDVPDSVPERVEELSERVTDRGDTRFQRAVLLQNWFRSRGGFRYSLQAPDGHTGDDILAFLNERVGYCEQFAAAMAVMARELDIPARVAVGFLHATPRGDNLFEYRFADMHAWPELYFEGSGWVRFEPTPASRDGATAPPYTSGNPLGEVPLPTDDPAVPAPAPAPEAPDPRLQPGGTAATGTSGTGPSPWWGLTGAVLLVALLPAAVRVGLRRRRLSGSGGAVEQAEAVWAELRDSMRDLGYDWQVDTPRRTAARVLPLLARRAGAESALRRLASSVERARFARTPADGSTLQHDLRLVVDTLKERETRWDRVKAAVAPRSLRGAYRRANRQDRAGSGSGSDPRWGPRIGRRVGTASEA